jgi:translation initiation factor IF-3
MQGIYLLSEAISLASSKGLDLVEVSPTATPPVCKIMDYGKFRYDAKKKAMGARKKQRTVSLKEIKLRPTIGENDFQVKLKSILKFVETGDKVKISVRFRGREIVHKDTGASLLDRIVEITKEIAKVEFSPRMEGRQMMMIIAPK